MLRVGPSGSVVHHAAEAFNVPVLKYLLDGNLINEGITRNDRNMLRRQTAGEYFKGSLFTYVCVHSCQIGIMCVLLALVFRFIQMFCFVWYMFVFALFGWPHVDAPPELLEQRNHLGNTAFSSWSLFESVYLLMHWSDCNDRPRTLVLQTVLSS